LPPLPATEMLPEARTAYSPGPPVDCMRHAGEQAVTVPPAPPAWYVTVVPRAMLSPPEPPLALQLKFGEAPKVVAPPAPPLVPFQVSTCPDVPDDELRTPVPLLSTTPAPRPLNVIVPDDVRPVRLVRVPAIVLLPTIVSPPAVLLMFPPATIVPTTVALPASACV